MFDFQQVGYELQKLSQQIEALCIKPAKQRLIAKKSPESTVLYNFTQLKLQDRVQPIYDQLKNIVKELLILYSTIYHFFNLTKPATIEEYTKAIECLNQLSDRLDKIKAEESTKDIIDKTKKLHLDIKEAIEEAFKATLTQKVLLQLEVLWANQKPNNWRDIFIGSSFERKMMNACKFLLEQVIKEYSEEKTISAIEKSFLNQINKQELVDFILQGMREISFMTRLASKYGGTFLEYGIQNHHSNYFLIGGGCKGSVIDWGRKLIEQSKTDPHSLKAYEETLTAFQNKEIPSHLPAFYCLAGESPLNPRVNLYQLCDYKILNSLNFFDWSKDGHAATKILDFFSDKEKISILEVQLRNSGIISQEITDNHSIGIAKIVTQDKTLYCLKDADCGEFKFYDLALFQEWLQQYFSSKEYDTCRSYTITNINNSLNDLIKDKIQLPSSLKEIMEAHYSVKKYIEENYNTLMNTLLSREEEKQGKQEKQVQKKLQAH